MELKFRPLKSEEIECRVSQIASNWCTLLLYKDARCDMNILDEVVTPLRWKREHTRDNANCIVSIYDSELGEWVGKEDTGAESYTEKEKGLASDSFKRACFNWGIGRELYTAPSIFIFPRDDMKKKGKDSEFYENAKGKYETKTRFYIEIIDYDENKNITDLIIRDDKGNMRFAKLTKEKEKELLKLTEEFKKYLEKAEEQDEKFDREKMYQNYGVKSDMQMTYNQIIEAIEILKKKTKKVEK